MAITNQQNIPNKPEIKESWTVRRLLSFNNLSSTISKVFINSYDILLGFIIFIIGLIELFGRHISLGFYILSILIFIATIFERHINIFFNIKENKFKSPKK